MTEQSRIAGRPENDISRVVRALVVVTAFWLILAARGFPFPHADDTFYTGAGLNMARGGPFVNPLYEGSKEFFYYPPLYSYVIAGWLRLFGISAASMVALHVVLSWGGTWCVIRGFQILKKEFFGWMVTLALAVYITCEGVRPDDCGIFFGALAFRLGVSPRARIRYLAPFFGCLGVATSPVEMAIVLPWIIHLMAEHRNMWKAAAAGVIATAVICLLMIHWEIGEFLRVFQAQGKANVLVELSWLSTIWYMPMGLIKLFYPVLSVGVALVLTRLRRPLRLDDGLVCLSVLLGIYTMFHTVSGHRITALITVIAIGYFAEMVSLSIPRRRMLIVANTLLIVGSGLRPMFQGITTRRTTDGTKLLQEVESAHPTRILVDQWSLRYVFNYRLMPGMVGLDFSARPDGQSLHISIKYPDECWVLAAESVNDRQLDPHGLPTPQYATICGKRIGHWVTNAGEIGVSLPGQ